MATSFPVVQNVDDLSLALSQSRVQEQGGASGVSFLKMNYRTGEFTLGAQDDIVTGDEVLINTPSIQHGWILWSGNRPQKKMVSFTADLPMPMDAVTLPNGKVDTPSEGRTFLGAMYDGGDMLSYEGNSYGIRKGVDTLLGQIRAHSAAGSKHLYPLVTLGSERYHSTKVMKDPIGEQWVHNPLFTIIAWCDAEGNKEGEPAKVIEAEAAPVEPEAAPEVTPAETQPEPPKRRQRRQRTQPAA
jgi:hypothetical protein|tara:strand:+ start:1853 stop:2581 length:729 start_codon:yes stop_codon:yes gene_type:complete